MSLLSSLNLSSNSLAVQQAALQTTNNNIANSGNADYTRQVANESPAPDQQITPGIFLGTGVDLTSVQRQIDDALQQRINNATSDASSASTSESWLSQVQSTFNALSGSDLSAQLGTFFNSWSSLANNPTDAGLRQVVLQNGDSIASYIKNLGGQLGSIQGQVNNSITADANNANDLAQQVADLNGQITTAEGGGGGQANNLRDQRDAVLKKLSGLMDIKTVEQTNGVVNVYVGSEPLVVNQTNRGVGTKQQTVNGSLQTTVIFKADNGNMKFTAGSLGSLATVQGQVTGVVNQLDGISGNLIFELNKLHSSGQGLDGFSSVTSTNALTDATVALNKTNSGLKFTPTTGSFVVHVKNTDTGLTTSTLVHVDENGAGTDTTLNSLATQLNGITDVAASVNAGQLTIKAGSSNVRLSFSQDSSGTLAALGINTFFTGSNSRDIAVNQILKSNSSLLAASQNGDSADNQTALAISKLGDASVAALNGASINQTYQSMVNTVATEAAGASTNAAATKVVAQTLENQRQNLSGVSLDEEAVHLMQQQRAFQGSARVITTINTMMDALMAMIP